MIQSTNLFISLILFIVLSFSSMSFAQTYLKDYLPAEATARFGKGYIFDFAYSPDGTRLAIASTIGVWIYDTETYEELHLLTGHTDYVMTVVFSPDSKTLVSENSDDYSEATRVIKLWDVATGELKATLSGHTKKIKNIVFSPDGKSLASASNDGTVRLWDSATGDHKATLTGYAGGVLSFSPDGSKLASAVGELIRLWDVATNTLALTFAAHANSIDTLIYSPDGKRLSTRGGDNNVCLWDANTGEFLNILKGDTTTDVSSIDFLKDGKTLAIASSDGTVRLWNADATEKTKTFKWDKPLDTALCSPAGRTYACAGDDGAVLLFDANTGELLHALKVPNGGQVSDLRYSPDGETLAASDGRDICFYSVNTGELQKTITGYSEVLITAIYAPNEKTVADLDWDGIVRMWDVDTRQLLKTFSAVGQVGHSGQSVGAISRSRSSESYIRAIAYSPDGATLACGTSDATILLWNVSTWKNRLLLKEHTKMITSVAFSPDGQTLVSAGRDKTILLWNVHTGELLRTLTQHTSDINDVVFSLDGSRLASCDDTTVRIWDVATGELLKTCKTEADIVYAVAFSPDGKTVAGCEDTAIHIWDVATGKLLKTIKVETGFYFVVYSPDGSTLASAEGSKISFWDVATGELLRTLTGHVGPIYSITYSSDGKTLVSGSADSTVILWDLAD